MKILRQQFTGNQLTPTYISILHPSIHGPQE